MENQGTMEENVRVMITISPYDHRRLRLWAALHGKTPTAYAGQIVSARIESNFDDINKQIEDYAKSKGITVDEAITELDGGSDV
jgi:hypothetical protein